MFLTYPGSSDLAVNVRGKAKSSTSISLQWEGLMACNSTSPIVMYTVRYAPESSGMTYTTVIETRRKDILLTGLVPYTNYSIEVAAMNEEGKIGPYSYRLSEETLEDCMLNFSNANIIILLCIIQFLVQSATSQHLHQCQRFIYIGSHPLPLMESSLHMK